MFVVMGASGAVGGAVACELIARGEKVTILTRDLRKAGLWLDLGAVVRKADVEDAESLEAAFKDATRAFLLNPAADPRGDTDATERRTIANILDAVAAAELEKVVAASTYGARSGTGVGDLTTLYELESGLRLQAVPAAVNRGAYYMTNWLGFTDLVIQSGMLPSMFPASTEMPMVAPADLGRAAADRLMSPIDDVEVQYVEGPARYSPQDVADAFAAALKRDVTVDVIPPERWQETFTKIGFSAEAAATYTEMTAVSLATDFDKPSAPRRGAVNLEAFITTALKVATRN